MGPADKNSEQLFHALSIQQLNRRERIVLKRSRQCKTVSGIPHYLRIKRYLQLEVNIGHSAHPEEYAPMDDLDDDELDEESPEAFETATATEIGDRRLERQPEAHGNGNGNGNGNSNSNNKKEKQKEKSP